ncbi:MAG TPA: GNAT family N-acetyltransferase, partial [Acetobacteraceae bacterium]|nr:GNAT family N-acetyltransferase [Acetobacteraceae bacterium]
METADPCPPIPWRDAEVLAALHREAFGGEAWSAAFFRQLLESPPVFGLVLGQGMVLAQAVAGEAEILTIGVVPGCRRQGIARLLLEAA